VTGVVATLEEPPLAEVPPVLEEPPLAEVPPVLEEPPLVEVPPVLEEPPVPGVPPVVLIAVTVGRAVPLAQNPKEVEPFKASVVLKATGVT
jgi:hypothetical protein